MESSRCSSKTLQKRSCPYAPLDEALRYIVIYSKRLMDLIINFNKWNSSITFTQCECFIYLSIEPNIMHLCSIFDVLICIKLYAHRAIRICFKVITGLFQWPLENIMGKHTHANIILNYSCRPCGFQIQICQMEMSRRGPCMLRQYVRVPEGENLNIDSSPCYCIALMCFPIYNVLYCILST